MRKSLHILALVSVLFGGFATATPVFAKQSHHPSGSMKGGDMMGGDDMMGMMKMMAQMNQMMESCTKMMQSATDGDHDPGRPNEVMPEKKG